MTANLTISAVIRPICVIRVPCITQFLQPARPFLIRFVRFFGSFRLFCIRCFRVGGDGLRRGTDATACQFLVVVEDKGVHLVYDGFQCGSPFGVVVHMGTR